MYLDSIKSTHIVHRIPAYDVKDDLVLPSEYQDKLAGSIAEVCFSIVHYHIRQAQKNVFNAVIRDMTILKPPVQVASTTSRQQLHSALHSHKKAKTRA
jgi:hypothetical protein